MIDLFLVEKFRNKLIDYLANKSVFLSARNQIVIWKLNHLSLSSFQQIILNKKIKKYLQVQNELYHLDEKILNRNNKIIDKGLCCGYASLWLCVKYVNSLHKNNQSMDNILWFYSLVSILGNWKKKYPFVPHEEKEVNRFISLLLMLQSPRRIVYDLQQGDLEQILPLLSNASLKRQYVLSHLLTETQIKTIFLRTLKPNEKFYGLLFSHNHALAFYYNTKKFFLYNANNCFHEVITNQIDDLSHWFFTSSSGLNTQKATPFALQIFSSQVLHNAFENIDWGLLSPSVCEMDYAENYNRFQLAIEVNDVVTARHLIERNDIYALCGKKKETVLHQATKFNRVMILNMLLRTQINLDQRSAASQTALTIAVERKYHELVQSLLRAGADPNVLNKDGISPLMHAITENDATALQLLLKHGASANFTQHPHYHPLYLSIQRDEPYFMRLLLQANANWNFEVEHKTIFSHLLLRNDSAFINDFMQFISMNPYLFNEFTHRYNITLKFMPHLKMEYKLSSSTNLFFSVPQKIREEKILDQNRISLPKHEFLKSSEICSTFHKRKLPDPLKFNVSASKRQRF